MKKIILLLTTIFIFGNTQAQENKLSIKPIYNYDSSDLYSVLNLLDVEITKFILSKEFYGHKLNFVIDEFTNGKEKEFFNLRNASGKDFQFSLNIDDSTEKEKFEIRFYTRKLGDTLLRLNGTVVNSGFSLKLHLKKKEYSWKDIYNLENNRHPIIFTKKYPLAAYTQPVGKKFNNFKGNTAEFCKINGEENSYKEWYSKLGIEHYFVFNIVVEK